MLVCRGVRGAIVVPENTAEAILSQARRLLALMIRLNGLEPQDVASAIFTTTPDLDAEFPALAARQLGWQGVALLCGSEMRVPESMARVLRVLVHWNTTKRADETVHVYVGGAELLRPDQRKLPPVDWPDLDRWILDAVSRFAKVDATAR
ncbi:MAG: chorismate mutase [Myxococcota bacterium]